jgi:hypothetical protein
MGTYAERTKCPPAEGDWAESSARGRTLPVCDTRHDSRTRRTRSSQDGRSTGPVATGEAAARKQHALALFAGLPRHYDRVGAALSFGQDPR